MKKFIVLFVLIPQFVFGQFGPTDGTTRGIDKIRNESKDDIVLQPNTSVQVEYFTGEKALVSGATKELEESTTTKAQVEFLNSITSNVQDQIDSKQPTITGTDGDLFYWNSGLANLGIGTQDQVLTVSALGFPVWADAPISTTLNTKGQLQGYSTQNANVGPCVDDQILVYDDLEATGWKCSDVPATSPTATIGDLIYNSLGTPSGDTRLPIGAEGELLTVSSGVPSWQPAPVSTTLTAKGEIQTHDGTANASFGPGLDGEVIVYDSAELTGLNTRAYSPLTAKGSIYTYSTTEFELNVGTDGQVLRANSATTSGLEWDAYSPLTTKGDLYVYGSIEDRLPIGGNGTFLVADSQEPLGVKWYDGLTTIDYDDNPVGTIIAYGSETVPGGYLLADGACYSKTGTYAVLFGVIGISAGECDSGAGAGSGFNVPDLRNEFLRGLTAGRSVFDTQADSTAVNGLSVISGGAHAHATQLRNEAKFGTRNIGSHVSVNLTTAGSTVSTNVNETSSDGSHGHSLSGDSETAPANTSVVYLIKAIGRKPITTITQKARSPNKAGFIVWSAFDTAIEGHLKADGSCVSKTADETKDYFKNVGALYGECDFQGQGAGTGVLLPDLITDNRFVRAAGGSLALGTTQTDATAVNGLSTNTTGSSHSHTMPAFNAAVPPGIVSARWGGTARTDSPSTDSGGAHTHGLASSDLETRPNAIALIPFVKMVDNDNMIGVDFHKLGDCKWSLLEVADFNAIHSGDWVRLEGQSLAGTDIDDKYSISSLPDAVSNGAFLRQNGGNSGALRAVQQDATAVNGLGINDPGHFHSIQGYEADSGADTGFLPRGATASNVINTNTKTTGVSLTSSDLETRPINVSLNFYCKVNEI